MELVKIDPPRGPRLLLSVNDTARSLGVSRATVFVLIRDCELPSVRVGRRRLIPADGLRAWVQARVEPHAVEYVG